jgi:senataxin
MAVVSPYKEQVQHIRDSNHNLVQSNSLEVNTVDAFQGQEKDIIIFSCVRTNNSGIGFLQDIRRLNVAITRAKYALYIVGNAETLKVDKTWSNLLHHFNLLDKIYTLDNN